MNVYEHTKAVTTAVHDELIAWAGRLMREAGLDVVDVWGRFPPEGTTRSHLVMFPYRVGPDPKLVDNSTTLSLFATPGRPEARTASIPAEWSDLGMWMSKYLVKLYPEAEPYDPRTAKKVGVEYHPFPLIEKIPKPLRDWYAGQQVEDGTNNGWLLDVGGKRARPPSLLWKFGIQVSAYYICVAGDPGRGTAATTSDTAPLALAALSVMSMGIQQERELHVKLPPRPLPDELFDFVDAFADAADLVKEDDDDEGPDEIRRLSKMVRGLTYGHFEVSPVHDLNNQEFALLSQALQRPLQAVLNLKLRIPVGAGPEFQPSSHITMRARNEKAGAGGR